MGQVAQINDPDVALAQRLILFKSLPTSILPDFLALALRSLHFQAQLEANATGSTALGIKADRLKALRVPVPTLDQQAKLVVHIRLVDEIRAQGSTALLRQVSLLNEHRQALITAAVTGQLEIPEAA
jgi:type I restriction enzyme, S subunit